MTPHSWCSRVAVLGLVGLALQALDVAVLVGVAQAYLEVLVLVQCLVCSTVAAKMLRDNCFESRLAAGVIGVASVVGALLAGTSGLPGRPSHGLGAPDVASIALGFGVLVMVLLDARHRRAPLGAAPPYAL